MRILMMSNTYHPIVGGLERSIECFTREYRHMGHEVLIAAPEQQGAPEHEPGVCRIPAIQNFNKTDFSIELPIYFTLSRALETFRPQIVHSHHPFLVGNTALRVAADHKIPVIFTHHTLYEENTHYVPLYPALLKQFVIDMATTYANACDGVIAPSEWVAQLIHRRGVIAPIAVVPTGVYTDHFRQDNGQAFRAALRIPREAIVVGTTGRLAPEKNLHFLMRAVMQFLQEHKNAVFLVAGQGAVGAEIGTFFQQHGVTDKLFLAGTLHGQALSDAYHAMDVFAFASHSETQGLVLIEAMAAGVPVVAVDAPGVRDVVRDGVNGFLVEHDDEHAFAGAVKCLLYLSGMEREGLCREAVATAKKFSMRTSAEKAISLYERFIRRDQPSLLRDG